VGTRRYILGKVLQALLTLAFVMLFNFLLFRVIPPDPLELYARSTTPFSPADIKGVTKDLGLDEPLPQQFLISTCRTHSRSTSGTHSPSRVRT
jgi:peptide/nickel transport system permease protein